MADTNRSLTWLQRRADGETPEAIADHDGVPVAAVRRATDRLLRAHQDRQREQRAQDWAALRRAGQRVVDIAAAYGVTRHLVGTETAHLGPFPKPSPTPDQVAGWVKARSLGVSVVEIARAAKVGPAVVSKATEAGGPYPRKPPRSSTPEGYLTRGGIARMLGVSNPTVREWERRGYLPSPDLEGPRRLWLVDTITGWLPVSGMKQCPCCGLWRRRHVRHPNRLGRDEERHG